MMDVRRFFFQAAKSIATFRHYAATSYYKSSIFFFMALSFVVVLSHLSGTFVAQLASMPLLKCMFTCQQTYVAIFIAKIS